jgi:iron complex transport system substrate-binding protein
VLTLDPMSLGDVLASIETLGKVTGTEEAAASQVRSLHDRLDVVRAAVAGREPVPVMVLEWTDPPFTPGHWVPDMVTAAGGVPVLGAAGARSVRTSWPAVLAARPAVVVAAPCGYGLADSVRLAEEVADRVPRDVPLWAVDANASFARPGPRLVDGVEVLAAVLHPDTGLSLDDSVASRVR